VGFEQVLSGNIRELTENNGENRAILRLLWAISPKEV